MMRELVLSHKRTQIVIWVLLLVMPIIGMAIDLISPALPAIASGLHTSHSVIQGTISIYLIGYAVGNFLTGFLSDSFGRSWFLRIGLFGFALFNLLPVYVSNIDMVLISRLAQGISLGAVSVVARATFSDILTPKQLIHIGTLISTMWGIGPIIGPMIGGYLQYYCGWKSCFVFLAIIAVVMGVATCVAIPETHLKRHRFRFISIKNNLTEVVSHKVFMAMVILMGLIYTLIISFNTVGPFLIQTTFGYSPIFFGHLALCFGLVFLSATFIIRNLIKFYTVDKIFPYTIGCAFLATIIGVVVSYFYLHSICVISVLSAIMFFACGMIYPPSMGKGLSLFKHIAGNAASVMYLVGMSITALASYVLSFVTINNNLKMAMVFFVVLLLCGIIYYILCGKDIEQSVS